MVERREHTGNGESEGVRSVILYADIIKSSGVALSRDFASYHTLIDEFQGTAYSIITHHLKAYRYTPLSTSADTAFQTQVGEDYEWDIEGDEARVFLYSNNTFYDLRSAILLALKLKLAFLTSEVNFNNFSEGRNPLDIAIGLHLGITQRSLKPWQRGREGGIPRLSGVSISKAQMVMEQARLGSFSKIAVSYDIQKELRELKTFPCHFYENPNLKITTFGETESVYELAGYFDHEVYWYLPDSLREVILERALGFGERYFTRRQHLWLSLILMRYYLDKGALGYRKEQDLSKIIEYGSAIIKEYGNEIAGHLHHFICTVHIVMGIAYKTMTKATGIDMYLERAMSEFETVLRISPENSAANFHIGSILAERGELEKALRYLQIVLIRDPYNPDARQEEARIRAKMQ